MSGPSLASLIVWHDSRMTDWPSVQPGERGRSVQVMRCRRRQRLHQLRPLISGKIGTGRRFLRSMTWDLYYLPYIVVIFHGQMPERCRPLRPQFVMILVLGEQPSSMVDAVQPSSASPATPSSGIVICLFCLKTERTIHVAIASDAQVVVTLAAYMDVVTPAAFHIAHTSDHRFSLRRR